MSDTATLSRSDTKTEHFDVLIVGAGISGVGGAYHLQQQCPDKSFVVLDKMDGCGGTWLSHKYPGVRSDSDLYTFGYRFKPWVGPPIATADEILKYMNEVIEENDLGKHIRYNHKIATASWSSKTNLWTVEARNSATGETKWFTCNFLWMCQGYYRHEEGYTPEWPGMDQYKGRIVHPQTWPEDLDYTDKTVLVIGSGATAATVIPAMAAKAKHITVLQRSPTYFIPGMNQNELADSLRQLEIPDEWIHEIVRRRILFDQDLFTKRCLEDTAGVTQELLGAVKSLLPEGYDMSHFTPRYRPWRQRIAFVPEGDIFAGISAGKATMVTDEIDTFTEKGVKLKSGKELEADIILTCTGFNLCALGDIDFTIDEKPLRFNDSVTYRGMMFTGIPNMVWIFGYFRASWTLRADLIGDFVCRLLNHMKAKGAKKVEVALRPEDHNMPLSDWLDTENFNPGYMIRGMNLLPKRGDKKEWAHTQDYWTEKQEIPAINLDGAEFHYG